MISRRESFASGHVASQTLPLLGESLGFFNRKNVMVARHKFRNSELRKDISLSEVHQH